MFELTTTPHSEITSEKLDQIIQIKSVAWPYSYEKQVDWINKNLKNADIHVLLIDDQNRHIAYLNLISIEIKLDGKPVSVFGIGNVCVLEKGKGWGKKLILKTNELLKKQQMIGLLFCKEALVKFYTENNWILISPENLLISQGQDVNTLLFDSAMHPFVKLEYHGKLF